MAIARGRYVLARSVYATRQVDTHTIQFCIFTYLIWYGGRRSITLVATICSSTPHLSLVPCAPPNERMQSLPFLPLYTWVGLWTAGLLGVCRCVFTVEHFTHGTDDLFPLQVMI